MTELRERILGRLDEIKDPCSVATGSPMGLAEMGLVKSLDISDDGEVGLVLRLTSPFCEMIGFLKQSAIEKIADLPAVASVTVESDSGFDWSPEDMAPHLQRQRNERLAAYRLLPLTVTRQETSA
jgi:metal-sulfur cluster biosynthetic enzyme